MMRTSPRRSSISLLAATGVLAVVAAACSASSTGGSAAASAAAPSAAAPSAASSGAAGQVYTVAVATGPLGSFLTGEDGKTLYVFTADSKNTSTCGAGQCATNWPAFTLDTGESVKAGDGVTGTLTTFARSDGKMQVAINGLPLYYFAKDTKAGDTNGEGIGGKWFVANPAGTAPSAAPAAAPSSAAPSSPPKY